jgi:ybaK/ebsC protein
MKTAKTNAARILDKEKITYQLIPYEVDEDDLSARHLAEQLGQDLNRIFKTLVVRGDRTGFAVCVVPGDKELDLKKAAKASGNKNCSMLPLKDLQPVTGYIRGGCSPIGMKKHFPTYIHKSALEHSEIYVSAGLRGLQLLLAPGDLMRAANAAMCDLIMEGNQ